MTRIYVVTLTLIILMLPNTLAHSSFSEHVHDKQGHVITIICTEHRNELAARGLGPIFIHKNKHCVAFADSSQQVLKGFAEWIYNSVFEVFTVKK